MYKKEEENEMIMKKMKYWQIFDPTGKKVWKEIYKKIERRRNSDEQRDNDKNKEVLKPFWIMKKGREIEKWREIEDQTNIKIKKNNATITIKTNG